MFTGIIQDIGMIMEANDGPHGRTLKIATHLPESALKDGASIACNGVCLTATAHGRAIGGFWFTADVSHETLSRTTLGNWCHKTSINLEPSLRMGDSLDGHLVFGHVDALGTLTSIQEDGGNWLLDITAPRDMLPLIAEKGSISVDGTSLTVNNISDDHFHLTIIPHTFDHTVIRNYKAGQQVHLEADMLARYVRRMLEVEN